MTLQFPMIAILMAATFAPALAIAAPPNQLQTRTWTLQHLGPDGLAKCRAFKAVVRHTLVLQKTDGGTITPIERKRIGAELASARAMTPADVTAAKCGVPL
jgi:hypothetical protein